MRCKPGERAILIHAWPHAPQYLGRIVRVTRQSTNPTWMRRQCWEFEEAPWPFFDPALGADGVIGAIPDAWLLPIRDPGEDATDEMLQLLGKPEATAIEFALQVER